MGRSAIAEPVHEIVCTQDDGARHAGLVGGAHDRRERLARAVRRRTGHRGFSQESRVCAGRLQGTEADVARLELPAASAHPAGRWPNDRVGLAPRGFPAPGDRARHARLRPSRDEMPAPVNRTRSIALSFALGALLWLLLVPHAAAFTAYVSNEKSNTVTVIDTDKLAAVKTIKVG